MQGTRHEDTMDVVIHSAHSVDLLSCCIEHGLVDTAQTRHRPQCMRYTETTQSIMFLEHVVSFESELSSVSVLSAVSFWILLDH